MQQVRNLLVTLSVALDTLRSGWHMVESTQGAFTFATRMVSAHRRSITALRAITRSCLAA